MYIPDVHVKCLIFPRPLNLLQDTSWTTGLGVAGATCFHQAPSSKHAQWSAKSLGNGITSLHGMMEHRVALRSCPQRLEGFLAPRRMWLVRVGNWYGCAFFSRCVRNVPTWFFFLKRRNKLFHQLQPSKWWAGNTHEPKPARAGKQSTCA